MFQPLQRFLLLAAIVVLLAAPAPAAEVDKYLLNDTDGVVSINVRQLVDAPLFKKHYQENLKKLLGSSKDVQQALSDLGLDPFKNIDRILAVHGENSHRLEDKPGSTGKSSLFLIVRGKFDAAKIQAKANQIAKDIPELLKVEKTPAGTIYRLALAEPMYLAMPDSTAIVGSFFKDQVQDALEKGQGKRKTELKFKDVQTLIAKVDAKQSLWLVATGRLAHSFDTTEKVINGKKQLVTTKDTLSNAGVENIIGGLTVSDGIGSEITIATKDNDAAKKVADFIQMDLNEGVEKAAKASLDAKYLEPLRLFLLGMQIKPDGKVVNAKSNVGAKEIADALK
jgi:hypothetical protein